MTDSEWMTVSEASEKSNIPVETIRRYIRSHSVHLRVKKQGKRYLLHDESMTVIQAIRGYYDRSMNADEVEESLSAQGIPMTITVKNDNDEAMTVHVADKLQGIEKVLEQQQEFNKLLLERLDAQDRYIKESLDRRDKALLQVIRESQQAQIEAGATAEQDKRGFWARLFNK